MTLEIPFTKTSFLIGSMWKLRSNVEGYKSKNSDELATQVLAGRSFQFIDSYTIILKGKPIIQRAKVRLLEDGYICWIKFTKLINNAFEIKFWEPNLLAQEKIESRIPKVLSWAIEAAKNQNEYLWGGTIGPNFDCSGLVQSAFASSGIWIPRDAYQQEKFCKHVEFDIWSLSQKLIPGDLLFFGSTEKCTHVGLHIENGFYIHSSGISNGHNGIAIDGLFPSKLGDIASFYRSQFRSAGRVISCYQSEIF